MAALTDIARKGRRVEAHHPWPRTVVTSDGWKRLAQELADARATMLGLWGDRNAVHLALIEESSSEVAVFTFECTGGKFPSIAALHPPAIRLERAISDLYGLKPVGSPDAKALARSRLLGRRPPSGAPEEERQARRPTLSCPSRARACIRSRSARSMPASSSPDISASPPMARPSCGSKSGSAMSTRASSSLMAGASIGTGAKLAGRTSGDSTVAYALAFAQAVEAALRIEVPPRAVWLRALMAELERIANHFGDIGAICNDASFSLMYAECGILRERTLRAAKACFGHRLMMDRIVPGGVTEDLSADGVAQLARADRDRAAAVSRSLSRSTTTRPRCRTAPSRPAILRRRWRGPSAPAAMSAAPRAAPSMRARRSPTRLTTSSTSRCLCATTVTSMPAFGSASARSSRASG